MLEWETSQQTYVQENNSTSGVYLWYFESEGSMEGLSHRWLQLGNFILKTIASYDIWYVYYKKKLKKNSNNIADSLVNLELYQKTLQSDACKN